MRIGIIFGGQSREREVSFAGGRTVYDNLDKSLFEPIPVFVDSLGRFILLDWKYLYKGTIRDFFPPMNTEGVAASFRQEIPFQIYVESLAQLPKAELDLLATQVGRLIEPSEFASLFDFAFLCLHGPYGEDGSLQGLLEWYGIPYSGAGILPSSVGIDKSVQQNLMVQAGFQRPKSRELSRSSWFTMADKFAYMHQVVGEIGLPLAIKAPAQGSSIGVSILHKPDLAAFEKAVNRSLFLEEIRLDAWAAYSPEQKEFYLKSFCDIREGIGMPCRVVKGPDEGKEFFLPEILLEWLNKQGAKGSIILEPFDCEQKVLFESFLHGKEFSCIVVEDDFERPVALPPTEIVKGNDLFDYRSKYLPGMSRKVTPIDVPHNHIQAIREACCKLFTALQFNVYARIDGFINEEGEIFLNDPNTTSGMLPSSFFFHQAAEIGLNPSQFLTFIIRSSLAARLRTGKKAGGFRAMLHRLDEQILKKADSKDERMPVAVIMGGYSSERHISVESGRNVYEKLASSAKYRPIPVFLTGNEDKHLLFVLPISTMLKDNADDIKERVMAKYRAHKSLDLIREEASFITKKYAGTVSMRPEEITYKKLSEMASVAFIALHGRPGEDGEVQKRLEKYGVAYNGSGVASSRLTINKFETNELLAKNGIQVANHYMLSKSEWKTSGWVNKIEASFKYPIICKPADDGCSSAVKKIRNREELEAFATQIFRPYEGLDAKASEILHLKYHEEFPRKIEFMIEDLISPNGADHFLEITGGLLTRANHSGKPQYEMFEASEALASGEVLSLEEKFLAGEGQNITPARYHKNKAIRQKLSDQVKVQLQKAAELCGVEGYARIDAFVRVFGDERAEVIVIEINSLPGMTPATAIFHQTAIQGYKPAEFIDLVLQYGIAKRDAQQKAQA